MMQSLLHLLLLAFLLEPSTAEHIVAVAEKNGGFGTLVNIIETTASSARYELTTGADMTFFGPSNLALKGVGVSSEISDEVVKAHIVRGTYTTDDLLNAKDGCIVLNTLSTVAPRIKVTVLNHGDMKILMVNNVHVIIHDLEADNGIFHGVDGMILPGSFTPCYHSTMRGISAAGPSLFGNGMVVTAAMSAVAVVAASSWILMSL